MRSPRPVDRTTRSTTGTDPRSWPASGVCPDCWTHEAMLCPDCHLAVGCRGGAHTHAA